VSRRLIGLCEVVCLVVALVAPLIGTKDCLKEYLCTMSCCRVPAGSSAGFSPDRHRKCPQCFGGDSGCSMSSCAHSDRIPLMPPLPKMALHQAPVLNNPEPCRERISSIRIHSLTGFDRPPFRPPLRSRTQEPVLELAC